MDLKAAEETLKSQGIYVKNEVIGGIQCAIGYEKVFKWSLLATQMNTFVIIGATDQVIDKLFMEQFSANCYKYARKNHKGWPRGLQAIIGSIAILQGNAIDRNAVAFCENPNKTHWSAFEIPVLHHIDSKKTIKLATKPLWGLIYYSHFNKLIDSVTARL